MFFLLFSLKKNVFKIKEETRKINKILWSTWIGSNIASKNIISILYIDFKMTVSLIILTHFKIRPTYINNKKNDKYYKDAKFSFLFLSLIFLSISLRWIYLFASYPIKLSILFLPGIVL